MGVPARTWLLKMNVGGGGEGVDPVVEAVEEASMRPIGLRVTSHKSRSEPSESRAARIADCEQARTTMATRGARVARGGVA